MTEDQTQQPNPETTHENVQYFQRNHQSPDSVAQKQQMDNVNTQGEDDMDDEQKNTIQEEKDQRKDGDDIMGMDNEEDVAL